MPIYFGNTKCKLSGIKALYYGNTKYYDEGGEPPVPVGDPLYFEVLSGYGDASIQYKVYGSVDKSGMQYSIDNVSWTNWTSGTDITISANNRLYVRNTKNTLSVDSSNYVYFAISGDTEVKVCGNVTSLVNYSALSAYCFKYLFKSCTKLKRADELIIPNTLARYCCSRMFYGCTYLDAVPELPATTLADYCYDYMFCNCKYMTVVPELPATTLATGCYQFMFYGCINITTAPQLPATTLAASCYANMFQGCSALTASPNLPATTLANSCYGGMFGGCSSLTLPPELPATTLATGCYSGMFSSSGLTIPPLLPATVLEPNCYMSMFQQSKIEVTLSESGTLFFTCPSTIPSMAVDSMFSGTKGYTYKPSANTSYYYI